MALITSPPPSRPAARASHPPHRPRGKCPGTLRRRSRRERSGELLRREVARGALQIIRHRPVILQLELLADDVGHEWTDTPELRMPEGIARARVGHQPAFGIEQSFRDAHAAVTERLDVLVDAGEEL